MPLNLKIDLDLGNLGDNTDTNVSIAVKANGERTTGSPKKPSETPNLSSSQATITPKTLKNEIENPCQDPFWENMPKKNAYQSKEKDFAFKKLFD
ncbi:hypothetical protein PTTG_08042 [Puccinia triticina 1-1 BBBD Race 1]|uniref:Uncharacterized protein n=1 Tax=Puccinia triticina (isolate 1-1 / race 1 (BBBD)) TaxID=630390 RepID=A0A180GFH1_PUCT1|nr:hypothetical protein PTTG_08042 [Puccinia triticina 1-1 BBBD Race 1]